ncbi:MAG TPA: MogA/MoaB family molybdenum cofactor biosynthesis protein [Acidimicrobiales bacterium]|nr:MogA/MoaB family molybdenum cofactor biosynthesis protein [Acidimicrobiales bacterium]
MTYQAPAYQAKVLTVSDSVTRGEREDESGPAVVRALSDAGFEVVEHTQVPDGVASVAGDLTRMASAFSGLIVTTGGTGFGPRDMTPEGTAEILDRHAPGLAEAMRRSAPLAALSRGIAGTRGHALVLNLPGSPKGAVECLLAVIELLPHAVALLVGEEPH